MGRKYRKRYYKNRHRRSIFLGVAILCVAFGLVVGSRWLPEKARELNFDIRMIEDTGKTRKKGREQKVNPKIRVVLMTNGYKGIEHKKVTIKAKSPLVLTYGEKEEELPVGKSLTVCPEDGRLSDGKLRVQTTKGSMEVKSLQRGSGAPEYDGTLEIRCGENGLVLINELPLETYLCRVVPSEMPASYELEALKAQAVCARSYACRQMENYAYPKYKAHVNDSTDYQVYGNSEIDERSSLAVKETSGQTVRYGGKIVTTYYYSTSCGKTTGVEAWGTKPSKENAYLRSVKVKGKNGDYEKGLPWYRWRAEVSEEDMADNISRNTGKKLGKLKSLKVTDRGPGGVVLTLKAKGTAGEVIVKTENKIRTALSGDYEIIKQDGSTRNCGNLLPSAFFQIKKEGDTYCLKGGGFGHGIGMSQTGANEMAKQGKDYQEILKLFYPGVSIE